MRLSSLTYVFIGFVFSASAFGLTMNDVSILLPLPSVEEFQEMLSPAEVASRGELLPLEAFRFLPVLSDQADQDSLYQNNLKVIGVRLDPCFNETLKSSPCRRQIRLVWQPLISVGDRVTTLDTAVHTFHEFSVQEWELIMLEWKTALKDDPTNPSAWPLQVNPVLQREKFHGKYWKSLRQLILHHCGSQNLIRVTAMTVRQNRVWLFMGIDRVQAGWRLIKIPELNQDPHPVSQSFFLMPIGLQNLGEFLGGASVLPAGQKAWFELVSDSKFFLSSHPESEIKEVVRRAIRIENPDFHHPGNTDCVRCHISQTVRLWAEHHFPKWDWKKDFILDRFQGRPEQMVNTSVNPYRTDRARAFGYFGRDPVISQRVIHETAKVVDALK